MKLINKYITYYAYAFSKFILLQAKRENSIKLFKIILSFLLIFIPQIIIAQSNWFSLPTYWETYGYGVGFNIEAFDLNNDNNKDIFISNFNTTDVYYGGPGILDDTVDITYTGKGLAICDFNGDNFNDLIALHFTSYDSTKEDYNGEILFYYGSDTANIKIDTTADYSIQIPTIYPQGWKFGIGLYKFGTQSGDLNNDGFDDLVISEPEYFNEPGGVDVGKIYIYLGAKNPDSTASFTIQGIFNIEEGIYIRDIGKYFEIGDINGDGIQDILLSSRQRTRPPNSQDSLEILYIFYGGANFDFQLGNESVKYESRVDRQVHWSEWFRMNFSLDDINGDNIEDLVVGGIGLPDQTTNVHYGSPDGIDTIPSFIITDPDTSDPTIWAGGISYNIGDFNNDSYDDFILSLSGYKTFTLHLGGPYVSNNNPYGLRGLLDANIFFPQKAINVGDQNGDGFNDFAVNSSAFNKDRLGYVIMMLGRDIPVDVEDEQYNYNLKGFQLYQNYPNPFNPVTTLSFELTLNSFIDLSVYNILGAKICTLLKGNYQPGLYTINFNSEQYNLSSGVFLYKIHTNAGEKVRKMLLIK